MMEMGRLNQQIEAGDSAKQASVQVFAPLLIKRLGERSRVGAERGCVQEKRTSMRMRFKYRKDYDVTECMFFSGARRAPGIRRNR